MVRELERVRQTSQFPEAAPAANPVFFRTYSRRRDSRRETWEEVCDRTVGGLAKLGQLLPEEAALLTKMQRQIKTLTSGRWLWVGGSQWIDQQENFSGAYNCSSSNITDWRAFGLLMDLAMMGCGTGAVLEPQYINQLPAICNRLEVTLQGKIGDTPASLRREHTEVKIDGNTATIYVGDSRQGWVESYQSLLELSTNESFSATVQVVINISDVRAAGETLKGFGGVANPVKLPELYHRCTAILNKAVGRQLNSVECCLLIDEAAVTIVAGNIRRCIAYGARVSAISGMKFIQDVQVGDLVLTSSGEYRPVVNKFIQGNQDVVEIRTPATSIRCTANHRVAVYDGLRSYTWKYAGELQKGDRLISIPHNKGSDCASTDFAWLLGFYIGDGYANRRKTGQSEVVFALSKSRLEGNLGKKCLRILRNLGYNPTVALGNERNYGFIKVYRKDLAEELLKYKQPWGVPIIPEIVWQGTPEIRAAFLAGLSDADGTPSRNVLVNSNKLEFLREVQKLALSLGIATTLHERKPKTLKGRDKIYEGCHWIHIRGLQSQAVTVALINQFAVRDGFTLKLAKKNGLSLPHQLVRELAATGWKPETICRADILWADPKGRSGHFRDANFDTLLAEDLVNPHWLPMEVQFVAPGGEAETFDIEVEGDHEFVADGLLVHNSAGMRQFDSEDKLGASAKDNLWQQDEQGSWRIDPERDALRMANHSRVFHYKPTLEECIDAVRKQYFSGEGAIQWAGEAVARANCDLLATKALKTEFLQAYHQRNAKQWLQEHYPTLTEEELAHRLARVGLNPCVTADTWIHTEYGAKQVKDLIGVQHGTFVNGELFSTTAEGFFFTGFKPVVKVQTQEGYSLRLTANHQVLKVTAQTEKNQYSAWCEVGDLKPGDRLLLHNHRHLQPWQGNGTFAEGYAVVGKAVLVHHEGTKTQRIDGNSAKLNVSRWQQPITMAMASPRKLSPRKLSEIEGASYEFVRGFLSGLFDTEGSIEETTNGVNIRWSHGNLSELEAVQRMLLRLGIVSTINIGEKELAIAHDNVSIFQQVIGCQLPEKASLLDSLLANKHLNQERFTVEITAIIPDGQEAVYDCTVPAVSRFDANGFVAHNCGEIIGSNFHCVSGDTLLITRQGMDKIKDVIGSEIEVWNGHKWSQVIPFKTGSDRQLYRVRFGDGSYLDATEYHRFFVKDRFGKTYQEVQTKDLMDTSKYAIHTEPFQIKYEDGLHIDPNYAYTLGVAVGDGTTDQKDRAKIRLYEQKAALEVSGNKSPERKYDYLPTFTDVTDLGFSGEFLKALKTNPETLNLIASWNRQAILHFIAGLADTDGSNTSGNGIRIYLSDYERAYRVQLLLTKCGIRSSVNLCAHQGAVTNYGIRSQDLYYLQITQCSDIPCQRLKVSQGKDAQYKGKWQVVRSVEQLPGLHDTYCFNEPENHKGVFGNTLTGNCNLSEIHLNQLDPDNLKEQEEAFRAGALSVAVLLNHKFIEPRYQYSRELDPIVGVSFTGLFDFFVKAFGTNWLRWWAEGRPETKQGLEFKWQEKEYLSRWCDIVHQTVWDYCERHHLKRPNRCTTVQPSGTKSLLTGASPGWHPPKAQRFLRRITFRKNDPVALACIEYGYNVIPSQSDKDEKGNLLDDPFDPRCSEWLVEIPVAVSWADLPGADQIDISKFSAIAQMDFYMQVQKHYVRHNTSATIELREGEIETLGTRIYEAIRDDEGYISVALLARFDDLQTFPRLPFEPISKEKYEQLMQAVKSRRKTEDFHAALSHYDSGELPDAGPAGCDSDKCLLPEQKPEN